MSTEFENKRKAWSMFQDPNLSLETLRNHAMKNSTDKNELRSIFWKVYLGYLQTPIKTWSAVYLEKRQHYKNLKKEYIEEPTEMVNKREKEDLLDNNPLALSETNPWQQYFADSEIRKVIRQDVERTFPDVDYFRYDLVQQHLTDILFIYCKLNRDTSYRQGMHELLAPIYWVVSSDSIEKSEIEESLLDVSDNIMLQSLDNAYIEHDAYILFDELMKYGKVWYIFNEDIFTKSSKLMKDINTENIPKPSDNARLNPIVMICHRIHHEYLRVIDPVLYEHLQNFGIEPQLYGLRWIRLLFGREFELEDLLQLWDAIFSQDPTLGIVEYICVVILLHMRDQLIKKDYPECLSMLMKPPHIGNTIYLVEKAKIIQGNVSSNTGLSILQDIDIRSGKPPRSSLYDGVQLPSVASRQTYPDRNTSSSNLDNSFSRITNNVMKTPQFREFNKAIAGVMESIQSNVNFGETAENSRRAKASEFPPSIDRVLPKTRNDGASISIKADKGTDAAKLIAMNKQMGKVVNDFISLLEKEMFAVTEPENREVTETQVTDQIPNHIPEEISEKTHKKEFEEKETQSIQENSKGIHEIKDNTELLHAMTGLKHVRDVLLGKQQQFDPDVMNIPDEDWAIVDHSEVTTAPTITKKERKDVDAENPLSQLRKHKSTFFETKLPHIHVPYVPDNPTPPKATVKYHMEDLLSDLQSSDSKTLTNDKLKSILTEQNKETTPNEIFRASPRKRNSFYINKTIPKAEENTIDPLDAKNVDNRKAYEYDLI